MAIFAHSPDELVFSGDQSKDIGGLPFRPALTNQQLYLIQDPAFPLGQFHIAPSVGGLKTLPIALLASQSTTCYHLPPIKTM
jgi:hypothetical protein